MKILKSEMQSETRTPKPSLAFSPRGFARLPRVARRLATLGWRTQSLWDCRRWHAGLSRGLAVVLALTAALVFPAAQAGAADAPPPSRVDALFNLEFANEYVTPRGMIVHDKGLTLQPLFLGFANLYKGGGFINDVTFVPVVCSDFSSSPVAIHPPFGSNPKTSFVEIDPIVGMSVGFAKNFTLSVTYTAFAMQILDIGTSQHLESKLAFNDSPYLKAFAVHPYFLF